MGAYTAIFDACVLWSAPLRDLLLNLAATDLFRARWTKDIHEEWINSLLQKGYDRQKLNRTRALIDQAVPDCLVTGYESLIGSLKLPDPDDCHVLAAAIVCGANVIVTANLRDFPDKVLKPFKIVAQHPDDFIVGIIDLAPGPAYAAIKTCRTNLKNPPKSVEEYLAILVRQRLPQTVEKLREFSDLV